jgi:hypothetical protein
MTVTLHKPARVSLRKSDFHVVTRYLETANPTRKLEIETRLAQSIAYVWGWGDAGGRVPRMTNGEGAAWVFGYHHARQYAERMSGGRGMTPSIHDAWAAFCLARGEGSW